MSSNQPEPKLHFRFETVTRTTYEVDAINAGEVFWETQRLLEDAEFIDAVTYPEAENIRQVRGRHEPKPG